MNESAQRFPLSWPAGWKRTHANNRMQATFQQTVRSSEDRFVNGTAQRVTVKKQKQVTVAVAIDRPSRRAGGKNKDEEFYANGRFRPCRQSAYRADRST